MTVKIASSTNGLRRNVDADSFMHFMSFMVDSLPFQTRANNFTMKDMKDMKFVTAPTLRSLVLFEAATMVNKLKPISRGALHAIPTTLRLKHKG